MEKDRKFRALAIAAICVAIVGVSVAYAALSATLSITGTATVSTENAWKVEWSAVTEITKSSAVTLKEGVTKPTITAGNQGITWEATFGAPKATLSFTATFKNSGTIPAKLQEGTYVAATGDASANFTYEVKVGSDDISTKTGYILTSGKEVIVTVTVTFDAAGALTDTELSALNNKTATFTLNLPFTQATDAEVNATGAKKF